MSKIIGVTVGTPLSADKIKEKIKPVLSVDGVKADAKGDVKVQRTHWKEVEPMVSLFNRSDVGYEYTQADRIGLEVGETYEVYYNGNTYDAVGTAYTADGEIGVTLKKADGTIPGCTIIDFSSKTAERIGYGFRISKPVSQYQTVTIIGPRITWHKLERGYLPDEAIQEAVEVGLEEAKASGKFDGPAGAQGEQGKRGPGVLKITTAPTSYTTAIGDYTPKYRILLSTVKTQSGVDEVLVGDTLLYTYYNYKIDYISGSYAYISATRNSIRGAAGEAGANGNDGYSPTVAVADITGGHRVTITDVNGTQTFDVMDGKDGAGGSGGGVTDYNKLENKPVGVDVVDILPETTVEVDPDNDGQGVLPDVVDVQVGKTYTVRWNGTDYICTAQVHEPQEGIQAAALGDLGGMTGGESTGEPFVVIVLDSATAAAVGAGVMFMALDGSTSVTLSITGEVVKKLDMVFLPEGYPYKTVEWVEVLPETTVECDPDNGDGDIMDLFALTVGNQHKVIWNGAEYTCTAQELPIEGGGSFVGVGDIGLIMGGTSTGEPFVVATFSSDMQAEFGVGGMVLALDGSTSATVSISCEAKVIHKMAGEYLPDSMPYAESFDEVILDAWPEFISGTDYFTTPTKPLVPGYVYKVNWGGVIYECIAKAVDKGAVSGCVLGNGNIIPAIPSNIKPTNEPFAIWIFEHPQVAAGYEIYGTIENVYYNSAPTEFSVACVYKAQQISKYCLPEKASLLVTFAKDAAGNYTADTFANVAMQALKDGRIVFARIANRMNSDTFAYEYIPLVSTKGSIHDGTLTFERFYRSDGVWKCKKIVWDQPGTDLLGITVTVTDETLT